MLSQASNRGSERLHVVVEGDVREGRRLGAQCVEILRCLVGHAVLRVLPMPRQVDRERPASEEREFTLQRRPHVGTGARTMNENERGARIGRRTDVRIQVLCPVVGEYSSIGNTYRPIT